MRVMVFETTKDRAKLIGDLLDSYRYKIFVNYQSDTAMNDVQEVKPSLIILNASIRPDSGISFLQKLKNDPKFAKIPVILISNFQSQEIADKVAGLPNVDYLVEPFKIKNFRHIVERWINFRSLYVN